MRKHQFSVYVYRLPKGHDTIQEVDFSIKYKAERVSVSADANNFYEAWCAAYNETVMVLRSHGDLAQLSDEETEIYTDLKEVVVQIHFSELLNPYFNCLRSFPAVSENTYHALTDAFNDVLNEAQKIVELPTFGRKVHFMKEDDEPHRTTITS